MSGRPSTLEAMDVRPPAWAWIGRISPRRADTILALALMIAGLADAFFDPYIRYGSLVLVVEAVGLVLLQTIPLIWRRDKPIAVLAVINGALVLKLLIGLHPTPPAAFAALISVYSVSVYSSTPWRSLVGAGAAAVFVIAAAASIIVGNLHRLAPLIATAIVVSGAWILGDYFRTRRAYLSELEAKAARLERDRAEDLRRAAEEERARIARELHDVVAHDVSVMVIQAGAARTVQADRPEAAAAALGLIERTGRQTLTELNQLLGVLRRTDGSEPVRAPQPGVTQLETLVDKLRDAAIQVEVSATGDPRPLPASLDLSVYRIVQEAATNILKHSRATRVDIAIDYQTDAIDLRIHDNGRAKPPAHDGTDRDRPSGHGLIGMRERAALYGGQLSAGPAPEGGFTVSAHLPLPPG